MRIKDLDGRMLPIGREIASGGSQVVYEGLVAKNREVFKIWKGSLIGEIAYELNLKSIDDWMRLRDFIERVLKAIDKDEKTILPSTWSVEVVNTEEGPGIGFWQERFHDLIELRSIPDRLPFDSLLLQTARPFFVDEDGKPVLLDWDNIVFVALKSIQFDIGNRAHEVLSIIDNWSALRNNDPGIKVTPHWVDDLKTNNIRRLYEHEPTINNDKKEKAKFSFRTWWKLRELNKILASNFEELCKNLKNCSLDHYLCGEETSLSSQISEILHRSIFDEDLESGFSIDQLIAEYSQLQEILIAAIDNLKDSSPNELFAGAFREANMSLIYVLNLAVKDRIRLLERKRDLISQPPDTGSESGGFKKWMSEKIDKLWARVRNQNHNDGFEYAVSS